MRTRRREEVLLRAVIQEYRINLTLPYEGGKSSNEPGILKMATKERVLVGLALYGGYKLYGEIKSAWESFMQGLDTYISSLGSLNAAADIITGAMEEGKDSTFTTKYGQIISDAIDTVLLHNGLNASRQRYIEGAKEPSYDLDKPKDFIDQARVIASKVQEITSKLQSAVNSDSNAKNFPANLDSVVSGLKDVDKLADIADAEKDAANQAMTDTVATAVYAKMQKEVTDGYFEVIIKDLDAKVKNGEVASEQYEKFKKDALKPAINMIGEAGKLSGRAETILVPA